MQKTNSSREWRLFQAAKRFRASPDDMRPFEEARVIHAGFFHFPDRASKFEFKYDRDGLKEGSLRFTIERKGQPETKKTHVCKPIDGLRLIKRLIRIEIVPEVCLEALQHMLELHDAEKHKIIQLPVNERRPRMMPRPLRLQVAAVT